MTDQELSTLIALLQIHSGISRVTYHDIAKGIRFAESQGWQSSKPAVRRQLMRRVRKPGPAQHEVLRHQLSSRDEALIKLYKRRLDALTESAH